MPPPSVETTHSTLGLGVPDAAAVKLAVAPTATVSLAGWVVTCGAPPPLDNDEVPGGRTAASRTATVGALSFPCLPLSSSENA